MKQASLKEKKKMEFNKIDDIPVRMNHIYEERVIVLRHLLMSNENGHSDSSSIDPQDRTEKEELEEEVGIKEEQKSLNRCERRQS